MPPDTPPGLADAVEVGDVEEVSIWNGRALALSLHGEGKRNAFIDMGNQFVDLTLVRLEPVQPVGLFPTGSAGPGKRIDTGAPKSHAAAETGEARARHGPGRMTWH
ncbi:MAG: hypothetical protein QOG25_3814 [Acetobacteraceae bacterium]|nr:hypothetical protein [Acetobacteraceae bacterium]